MESLKKTVLFIALSCSLFFPTKTFAESQNEVESQNVTSENIMPIETISSEILSYEIEPRAGIANFSVRFNSQPPRTYWSLHWGLGTLQRVAYIGGGQYIGYYAAPMGGQ